MEESKSTSNIVIESIKSYLSNPSLSIISEPKPWISDFFSIAKFSKANKEDIFNRAKENLMHYLPNYLILLFTFLILGVLSKPDYIVCLLILGGIWAYLYSIKTLVLSGKEITPFHKNLVIAVAGFIVTVFFAWEIVFYTSVFVMAGVFIHASLHNPPEKYGTYAPPQIPV